MAIKQLISKEEKTVGGARAVRGPSYPNISLEDALGKARLFWQQEKRSAAPISAAARHWGYSETSSSSKVVVAALLHFGLLEGSGSSDNRTVKLTARALDILLDEQDSQARLKATQDAARAPKLYADILRKWSAHELPSDQTMRFYLLREKGFNEGSIAGFLKDFRKTLSYAKLDKTPIINTDEALETYTGTTSDDRLGVQEKAIELNISQERPTPPVGIAKLTPVGFGIKQDTFSLDEGQVVLQVPEKMSEDSYADFKDWIELQLRRIKRSVN